MGAVAGRQREECMTCDVRAADSTLADREASLVLVGRDQVVLGLGDALEACWEEWLQRIDLLPSGQRGVAVGVGHVLRYGGGRVRVM